MEKPTCTIKEAKTQKYSLKTALVILSGGNAKMHEEYTVTDLLEEINRLNAENTSLRNTLSCFEDVLNSLQEIGIVNELLSKHAGNQAFALFQKHFLDKNDIVELSNSADAVSQLLISQRNLSVKIKKKLSLFSEFERLNLIYEKLSVPEGKLILLLQMTGDNEATNILERLFDGQIFIHSAEELLVEYYGLIKALSDHSINKSSFWNEFALEVIPDTPMTEKEKRKIEIRDNTIKNMYCKYGDKLFSPQHMAVLWDNLSKAGIKTDSLSEAKIKQICRRV
jgi:hypothetical protein